ncbi:MAG: repair protein RadC [Myxococcaceae bacterium]|jgi:DNA repair protein RadC|nr:repair protein RadC [Myxococcaceae bacterium]MEA2750612.1 repair protein RadC [Myxococcales bacterium]
MAKRSLDADVEAWSGEVLLARILACGRVEPDRSPDVEEVAAALLCDLGGFSGLSRATVDEIAARLSSGPRPARAPRASARRIAAAFELGRRATKDALAPASVTSSADVAAWAATRLSALDHEELWLLALDGRSRLRAVRCVARGGLHGMGVRAADPIRLALRAAASGFVLVHNHPSGDPAPSAEDLEFTRRVAAAAAVVGTPLLDHVVVASEGFSSIPFDMEGPVLPAWAVEA